MLIDLLVQVIFVFTLLLIASEALEGSPTDRGYVTPEVWKTLISIFDVDPKSRPAVQAAQIEKEFERLRSRLDECDQKLGTCEKKLSGGPGYPICRDRLGKEEIVLRVFINAEGLLETLPLEDARRVGISTGLEEAGRRYAPAEFIRAFGDWDAVGRARSIPCRFGVSVEFDPKAAAVQFEAARLSVWSRFRVAQSRARE